MRHQACIRCMKSICKEVNMPFISVRQHFIEISNNTAPEKLKLWEDQLLQEGMNNSETLKDPLIEKILTEICNIFIYTKEKMNVFDFNAGHKFSLQEYLPTVIKGHNFDAILYAFSKVMNVTPQKFFDLTRWENLINWLSQGINITQVSQLALFQNPQSLCDLFKKHTGLSPTDYILPQKLTSKYLKLYALPCIPDLWLK